MNSYSRSYKPDWEAPQPIKLLYQVRERVHYLLYSLQTEKACFYWAKAFVLRTARSGGGFRDPREMGQAEVEGFMTMLAIHLLQTGTDIRTVQELLGLSDVSTTMTYTHVLKVAAGGTASPLDALAFEP